MAASARPPRESGSPDEPPGPDDSGLPAYPSARQCPFHPPAEYGRLRETQPVARVRFQEQPLWLVTSHEAAKAVLRDPRFSTDPAREGFPTGSTAPRPAPDPERRRARSFLTMDEPEHGRYRRMLIPAFGARRTEDFRPRVEAVADDLIDRLTAGGRNRADFVAEFALPLPSRVICSVLGIGDEGAAVFQEKSAVAMDPARTPDERLGAAAEFTSYLADVIADRHRSPGDDLLSRLVAEQVDTGQLDDEQLGATAMALLIAASETTTHTLALGLLTVTGRSGLLARIREEPTAAGPVVEEVLRMWTVPHRGLYRAAVEDVEVGDRTIRAGEGVVVSVAAADRDPAVFDDPDTFDPDRTPRPHLAFGHGAHRCLGEPLARLELTVALRRLAERLPGLRPAVPADELSFREDHFIYGLDRLPLIW